MTRFGQQRPAAGGGSAKGRFAGVNPAGNRFPQFPFDFSGEVEVLETRRATTKGDTFIADLKVITSDVESVTPGETFSWVQAMTDKWNTGAGKVIRFCIAVGDLDDAGTEELLAEAEEGASVLDAACGVAVDKYGEQPLKGMRVRVRVTKGQPDQSGGHWRECAWTAVAQPE